VRIGGVTRFRSADLALIEAGVAENFTAENPEPLQGGGELPEDSTR
jgi:hypothetical protein